MSRVNYFLLVIIIQNIVLFGCAKICKYTNLSEKDNIEKQNKGEYENGISSIKYRDQNLETTGKPLVTYTIVDGIEKYCHGLYICRDGRISYSTGKKSEDFGKSIRLTAKLKQRYVDRIIKTFNKNNFFSLKINISPLWNGFNFTDNIIKYYLRYNYNSNEKFVMITSKDTLPQELWNIIRELDKVINAIEKKEIEFRKDVLIKYIETGGCFGGGYSSLTICRDGRVYYATPNYNLEGKISKKYMNKIIEIFDKNKFLTLNDKYFSGNYSLSRRYIILYNCGPKGKTVIGELEALPPQFLDILSHLSHIIQELKKDINSGVIVLRKAYPSHKRLLKKWPFSARIKLADFYSYYRDSPVDEDIFNYVKENARLNVLYFENEFVYQITHSTRSSNLKHKGYYLKIHNKLKPIQWPKEIGVKLSNIPHKGVFIQGRIYHKIKNYIETYRKYFIEGKLKEGNYIYEIYLIHGVE